MAFHTQPILENESVQLRPLQEADLPELYAVAADPKIWEQHPNKDRWQEPVFRNFFDGAMQSGGAFAIISKETGRMIGSTRMYAFDESDNSIFVGYTFYSRDCWGKGINQAVKKMMLDYLFQYVDQVYFHIGASNIRSQVAITRLGAEKIAEESVAYVGEAPRLNFKYRIAKNQAQRAGEEPVA
ncbi:GNAT family N-acetyltransferase [Chitinophaga sp.]|uniref:GNAT family N-acetyltransferase n=1 Tax=Chitinophaga sp. TaxID=1869181 RepID=UPI0026255F43|nr:GNAT family N-acetyltransferase [uncultured Chitinophaga sp.]